MYPERAPKYTEIPSLFCADESDKFYVHYIFVLLHRLIKGKEKGTEDSARMLLCTVLALYGWEKTPLYSTLQDKNSTMEEIRKSRSQRFDENGEIESLVGIRVYWSYHDALLQIPMSWYRPKIMAGDVFCDSIFRRSEQGRGVPLLPSFADEAYVPFRETLVDIGARAIPCTQDIERVFVEFYGFPCVSVITVQDIIKNKPEIRNDYLMSWQDC